MKNSIKVIIGVILIIALYFVFFNKSDNKSENRVYEGKSIKNRIFKKKSLEKVSEFEVFDRIIRLYKTNESIYLIGSKIIEYSLYGKEIRTFGKDGDAPWENSSIWYFEKVEDGYYIIDRSQKMIKFFLDNDSLDYYFLSDGYLDNGTRLKQDNFLYTIDDGTDFEFSTRNIKQNKILNSSSIKDYIIREFGHFPKSNRSLVFEGNYARNTKGESIYYMYKFGLFIVFNNEGVINYFHRTIDEFDMPQVADIELSPGYSQLGIEPDNFVNYSACMDSKYIYILSNVLGSKYSTNRVVDVYSLNSGSYKYTIKIPVREDGQMATEICKSDDNILSVMHENMTIVNFKINDKI